MSEEVQPYETAAWSYFRKGWSPVPIPPRSKSKPPDDYTGYLGRYVSGADIQDWIDHGVHQWGKTWQPGNIVLRLPDGVLGIDVDCYGEKRGRESLASLESRFGPLPPTYVSTSRHDGISGIRMYRVKRMQREWKGTADADIEVIHYGDRYMVVAPSLHRDTGEPYIWLDPSGKQCSAPEVEDLPWLPEPWVEHLDRGSAAGRTRRADVTPTEAFEELNGYPEVDGPMCKAMRKVVDKAGSQLSQAAFGSRHDTGRDLVMSAVRHGEMGHHGVVAAVREIERVWLAALSFGEKRGPTPNEFEHFITSAVAKVLTDPTKAEDIRCCGPGSTDFPVWEPPTETFWEAREELSVIRQTAWASMAAPWATLLAALTRVICCVQPRIVLPGAPALIGGDVSLNLFCGLVGASGTGKGAAEAAAARAVELPDIWIASVGSGEGIGHMYAHREKGQLVNDRDSVLFSIPEVDTLTALGNRQGATLMPQLRSAYMGEQLGFGTADITRRIRLEPHTYRMGLLLGIQPDRAEALMRDAAGGTPQRFLLASVIDRQAPEPDALPPMPLPFKWTPVDPYLLLPFHIGLTRIEVCEPVRAEVRQNRWKQNKGETDAMDAHSMLSRLKAAAAFGILNGRLDINPEDWELSGTLLAMSTGVRNGIEQHLRSVNKRSNEARAHAEADRVSIISERSHVERVKRAAEVLVRALQRNGGPMSRGTLRRALQAKNRGLFDDAVELLITDKRISVNGDEYVLGKPDK